MAQHANRQHLDSGGFLQLLVLRSLGHVSHSFRPGIDEPPSVQRRSGSTLRDQLGFYQRRASGRKAQIEPYHDVVDIVSGGQLEQPHPCATSLGFGVVGFRHVALETEAFSTLPDLHVGARGHQSIMYAARLCVGDTIQWPNVATDASIVRLLGGGLRPVSLHEIPTGSHWITVLPGGGPDEDVDVGVAELLANGVGDAGAELRLGFAAVEDEMTALEVRFDIGAAERKAQNA